ncbi:MAG: DUF4332 domain-containing protein [Candidatus Hermodarchaeota archaeon]
MMDEAGFQAYLKRQKKPQNTIDEYSRRAKEFNELLLKTDQKNLDEATPEDIKRYYNQLVQELRRTVVNRHLWALLTYYRYKNNDLLYCVTNELLGISYLESYKLKDFEGVEQGYVKVLASNGIKTAQQLLDLGKTKEERDEISKKYDIPSNFLLELVKLANLARIAGLKKKRARLFYDAGLDTLDKIAAYDDSEELRTALVDFVKRSGFSGTASTPTEAAHTLLLAKYLKRIIEY